MPFPPYHPRSTQPAPLTLTNAEFQRAFPAESDLIEWKEGLGADALRAVVVAFSNTNGGVVLVGVDDHGHVQGKKMSHAVEDAIHAALAAVRGGPRYSVHELLVEQRPIVIVAVEELTEGFAQTPEGRVLVRRGARNLPLFDSELARFVSRRLHRGFESRNSGVALDDASPELTARLAEVFGWGPAADRGERLQEQGLAVAADSGLQLTVAGALYLTDRPDRFLGKTYVEVFRYPTEEDQYDRRIQIDGALHQQVENTTRLVMDELGSEIVVLGLRRHELPRLPRRTLREAIANAVAHREYEMSGSSVRLELRPGYVRITSPGSLPPSVTEENIRESAFARNRAVIRTLRAFRLAEDEGTGVDLMQDQMKEELLDPPEFRDTGHSVEVTLSVRGTVTPQERAWVREVEERGEIEAMDRVLLVHAARGEVLTNSLARSLLHTDREVALRSLQRLRSAGFLIQEGRRAAAKYRLAEGLQPPAGLRLGRDELKAIIVDMARAAPIKNADIRARTGVDRVVALTLLDELVSSGDLVRRGQRRGTHYVHQSRESD